MANKERGGNKSNMHEKNLLLFRQVIHNGYKARYSTPCRILFGGEELKKRNRKGRREQITVPTPEASSKRFLCERRQLREGNETV